MKSLIPVGFLVVALGVLALLQYRWIGEISQAERQRLQNAVRDSSDRFARDFAELDPLELSPEIFPELQERHFPESSDQDYRIAVVRGGLNPEVVYSSPEDWNTKDLLEPDYAVDLFAGPPPRGGVFRRGGPPPRGRGPGGPRGPAPLRLLVRHEAGSLEGAVDRVRQRNLAVSFGILVVLAGAAFTVLVSAQRARTLGKMQIEFAAGVSHELRTPLAVIQSAAHNLRSGVIREPQAIEQYAELVQGEARRLSDMVEQVMAYAETQSGKKRYDISAVDVRDVIDQALKTVDVQVKQRIDHNLPPVMADPQALSQCLQNLLSNALKYGGLDNKVEIEIEALRDKAPGRIRLSVIDHGRGVPPSDVRQLFEPFHRGTNALAGIPGNGLGLHLVRKAMEAQKGTVEYAGGPAGGAVFTLIIPVA